MKSRAAFNGNRLQGALMLDPHDVRRYAPIEYDEMRGKMVAEEDYDRLLAQWQSQRDTITKLLAERAASREP